MGNFILILKSVNVKNGKPLDSATYPEHFTSVEAAFNKGREIQKELYIEEGLIVMFDVLPVE